MTRCGNDRALALLAVLVVAAWAPPSAAAHQSAALSPAPHPAAMGLAGTTVGAALQGSPTYDEQLGTTFTQDFSTIAYNVTAVAQTDSEGYGPAYLVNGLTAEGYWYQVGVSYHWPTSTGGYDPNFGLSYQVFGPSGKPVYPTNGGAGLATFSGTIHSGDQVLVSLAISGSTVTLSAQDWITGATAKESYSSEGATTFIGLNSTVSNSNGFFSGLMTEWYHSALYSGNEGEVTYTNDGVSLASAWLWIDEFQVTTSISDIFDNATSSPVDIASAQQLYPFSAGGATSYISAHQYITGLLTQSASSRITFLPAAAGSASPTFSASYTLNGQATTASLSSGASVVQADSGTTITLSINQGTDPLERWVFNGTSGTQVSFPAGDNETFVFYHLLQEQVSYSVASGGQSLPSGMAPVLTFDEPPAAISSTSSFVPASQVMTTTPATVFALAGSIATVNGTIRSETIERWATSADNWTISSPDSIPEPVEYYQQYEVAVGYALIGGGTPSQEPAFTSTSFGSPTSLQLQQTGVGLLTWLDAGSSYSFTGVLNGSSAAERWQSNGTVGAAPTVISNPNGALTLTEDYVHQYYAALDVNDPSGGALSATSGWLDAAANLSASASADHGWRFEGWTGSGTGAYSGTDPALSVRVTGPISENATFYVELEIAALSGTDVRYSSASANGTVPAGTNATLYIPPASNVTLRATPSLFVYSFGSWSGVTSAKPTAYLVVDSPSSVTAASSYDYPVILGLAVAVLAVLLGAALAVRSSRRRRDELYGPWP